ncbi:MAG: hypothetical protein HUK06_02735 [Bacteroidaceae bacterium]|nr:hypothetical protein [Bacteroidaceae bacterium]
MKKSIFLILSTIFPLMASFTSCSKDSDDRPNVKISLDVERGTVINNVIYAAVGDTIIVGDVKVQNSESKPCMIDQVTFYWQGIPASYHQVAPYRKVFPIAKDAVPGDREIDITCRLIVEGYPLCTAFKNFPVKLVASKDDIPQPDSNQHTITLDADVQ